MGIAELALLTQKEPRLVSVVRVQKCTFGNFPAFLFWTSQYNKYVHKPGQNWLYFCRFIARHGLVLNAAAPLYHYPFRVVLFDAGARDYS